MEPSFWVCAVVTLASALTSLGFSVAAARTVDEPGLTNARYALSRSAALAVVSVVAIAYLSVAWLTAIAVAMVLVQGGDAIVGRMRRDAIKTAGPAATALVNLGALLWMLLS
jgi:hypothetical protein